MDGYFFENITNNNLLWLWYVKIMKKYPQNNFKIILISDIYKILGEEMLQNYGMTFSHCY